jgi:diaminopimelate epimerase
MHGQVNDFVVARRVRQPVAMTARAGAAARRPPFRRGLRPRSLLVEPARCPGNDFRYRIWNADGGEVEQCGTGARCFARFVRDEGLTRKSEIRVETASGVIVPRW